MTDDRTVEFIPTPEPRTLHELAQRSVDNARAKLECAAIELAGAIERRRMVMARDDRPLAPPEEPQWTPWQLSQIGTKVVDPLLVNRLREA